MNVKAWYNTLTRATELDQIVRWKQTHGLLFWRLLSIYAGMVDSFFQVNQSQVTDKSDWFVINRSVDSCVGPDLHLCHPWAPEAEPGGGSSSEPGLFWFLLCWQNHIHTRIIFRSTRTPFGLQVRKSHDKLTLKTDIHILGKHKFRVFSAYKISAKPPFHGCIISNGWDYREQWKATENSKISQH